MSSSVYSAVNRAVLDKIPKAARLVLDLGCGDGSLGESIKHRQSCKVIGVTRSAAEASIARGRLDEVLVHDLETWDPRELKGPPVDAIICSHILEHLREPREFVSQLMALADANTTLVVAIPNIVHWRQRIRFLGGSFRYTSGGLLDRTHLRFFDWAGAQDLCRGTGWRVELALADGHFPGLWRLGAIGRALDQAACRLKPNLFGDQFILIARPDASVGQAA